MVESRAGCTFLLVQYKMHFVAGASRLKLSWCHSHENLINELIMVNRRGLVPVAAVTAVTAVTSCGQNPSA